MTTPPDRSRLLTEQRNPRTMNLHALSAADLVRTINAEDATIPAAVARAAPAITAFIEAAEPGFVGGRGGRLIYLGAGTSGRLGVLDSSEAPPSFHVDPGRIVGIIAGGDSALRRSSEGREDDPRGAEPDLRALNLTENDTVLGIAAGGTTPYVLGALELAKTIPTRGPAPGRAPITALLACSPVPKPPHCDHLIVVETGPEVLTGSTRMKAGTATKLVLNTISTALMVRSGRVYRNLMVDLRATNDKLRDRGGRIISTLTNLDRPAALALLDRAQGKVKAAIVMHARALDLPAAESLLAAHAGRLDAILDAAETQPRKGS